MNVRLLKLRLSDSISKAWETIAPEADAENYPLVLGNVVIGEALPKTSYIDTLGMNGAIDLSEAVGLFYSMRQITFSLQQKAGQEFEFDFEGFKAKYSGQLVDIIIGTSEFEFYTGRLSVVNDDYGKDKRTIDVSVDCEPLRYSAAYSPNGEDGQLLTPRKPQSNMWEDMDIITSGAGVTVTETGFTATSSAPVAELEIGDISSAKSLHRIYISNLHNVAYIEFEVLEGQGAGKRVLSGSRGEGSTFVFGNINGTVIRFVPLPGVAYSANIAVQPITTQDIRNDGMAVPLEIQSDMVITPANTYKLWLNLNGTQVDISSLYNDNGEWKQSPELILKRGINTMALFINAAGFNLDTGLSGSVYARFREGNL